MNDTIEIKKELKECEFCGAEVEYLEYRNSNIKDYFLCYFCAVGYDLHLEEENKEN